jgi:Xaa-Pro dipeptidase
MDHFPLAELAGRWNRCRELLRRFLPDSHGMLVFSRLNIYYLTGSLANGMFWLPRDGEPVLLCRRGLERARLESPLAAIHPFRSYGEVAVALHNAGSPLGAVVAAEMNGLSWALAGSLTKHLVDRRFVAGDRVLALARAVKSERELAVMRKAGARHGRSLRELLPPLLAAGMSEREIAHALWHVFMGQGHQGLLRMENYGEEVFLGHVAAGESANYPSVFNGPVGLRGEHPAIPHMGSAGKVWEPWEPLVIDCGFVLEGYQTDRTQVYWPGERSEIPELVRAAHDFCIELQAEIAARLRPGALPSGIWAYAQERAVQAGWAEGFMALGGNKVHFAGHGIGLAVDEYPVLAKGFDEPLETGMTLAVEPKIGIPGLGMVGVENTFEVTPGGGRSLTGEEDGIICRLDA